jgi:hypothetical protein
VVIGVGHRRKVDPYEEMVSELIEAYSVCINSGVGLRNHLRIASVYHEKNHYHPVLSASLCQWNKNSKVDIKVYYSMEITIV